jgi:hypothetical protein
MPYGDRTGPQGLGPRTGRGAGYCSGFPGPGSMNPVSGRGFFGFGRGRGSRGVGRGRCWRSCSLDPVFTGQARGGYSSSRFAARFTDEEEMDILRGEAEILRQQLNDIQNRMSTLEKSRAKQDE